MSESSRAAIAAGLAAGYLLGRSKKGKLAFAVASFAVGRKVRFSPRDLVADGLRKLCDSPQCRQLTEQVRGDLLTSGRSALKAVVDRELNGVADLLADRTRALGDRRPQQAQRQGQEQGQEQDREQEQEQGQAQEQQGQGRQPEQPEQSEQPEQPQQPEQREQLEPESREPKREPEGREPSAAGAPARRRPGEPLQPRKPMPRRTARPRPSARARGGESR